MARMSQVEKPAALMDTKVRLYLEGPTDCEIIQQRWLDDWRGLAANVPELLSEPAGGCDQVLQKVRADLQEPGVVAMGLLDRDVLLGSGRPPAAQALFFEPDDEQFWDRAPKELAPDVAERLWVLAHWEVENLTLHDPEVLFKTRRTHGKSVGPAWSTVGDTAEHLLQMAEELRPWMAASVLARGQAPPPEVPLPKKGSATCRSPEEMRKEMLSAHGAWLSAADLEQKEAEFARFDLPGEPDAVKRWQSANRVVDGKQLARLLCGRCFTLGPDKLPLTFADAHRDRAGGELPAVIAPLFSRIHARAKDIARRPP